MNPINFSDAAVEHIQKMLEKNQNAIGFRLSIKKTGCSGYAYVPELAEKLNEKDIAFTAQQGLKVYVDRASLQYIDSLLIDFINQGMEKRLVFTNPKESGRCGCGESFTIENKHD